MRYPVYEGDEIREEQKKRFEQELHEAALDAGSDIKKEA